MGNTDNAELLDIDFKEAIGCLSPVGLKPKNHLGKYDLVYNAKIIYVSDLHLDFYIKNKSKAEKQIYDIIDKMIENTPLLLYLNYPEKAKEKQIGRELLCLSEGESVEALLYSKYIYIVFGGDIAENYEYSKIFYHRIRELFPKYRMVAVLGNHEIASFKTVKEALKTYGEFLLSENIVLLNNAGVTALDTFMLRQDELDHIHGMNIFDWPDRGLLPVNELCFYGGIGFNKYDDAHTSETIRTCPELQGRPDLEAERCESFIEGYKKALAYAKEYDQVLVVLSHYPIYNWLRKDEIDPQCYYFYGHDHKNDSYAVNGAYVYGDNQVGYDAKEFAFKAVSLDRLVNPFYAYEDGCHKIKLHEYLHFYRFSGEKTIRGGGKKILRYMDKGYSLFMIKKNGYYGFFLASGGDVIICQGGNVTTLPYSSQGIKYYSDRFDKMVSSLIRFLLPLRSVQEQISKEVKAIGGDGSIHGLIIDYDFTHHIMINPYDGTLAYYYSPRMGWIQNFKNVECLVDHACGNKLEVKNRLIKGSKDFLIFKDQELPAQQYSLEPRQIEVGDSLYMASMKIRNLERIITSGILREWNENLMSELIPDNSPMA